MKRVRDCSLPKVVRSKRLDKNRRRSDTRLDTTKLPESLVAESSILGGILLNPSNIQLTSELRPEHFVHFANRLIFARMVDLENASRPIDTTTLCDELNRCGELEDVGGVAYIGMLLEGVPDHASIGHYAQIVQETAATRQVALSCEQVAASLTGSARPGLAEILSQLDAALEAPRLTAQLLVSGKRINRDRSGSYDGAAILDANSKFIARFVVLSKAELILVALWIAHTHAIGAAGHTPYLAISSAEKQSGKTRLLEVLELTVANPWLTGRVTPAVLVRKIDACAPTLLLDETDAAFKSDPQYAQALRGILNSGYRFGAKVSLCVGEGAGIEPKDFHAFGPKALAGIGELPDTVADRSIPIRLKRKARGEGEVERFRYRLVKSEAEQLYTANAEWSAGNLDSLRSAQPLLPQEISDRQQDCVEPLLAIADAAGGDRPVRAREAVVQVLAGEGREDGSIRVMLLADIRRVFEARAADKLTSKELLDVLVDNESSPWPEFSRGKPLSASVLARLLRPFGIAPRTIRIGEATPKGYICSDFADSWSRYLPQRDSLISPVLVSQPQQPPQASVHASPDAIFDLQQPPVVAAYKCGQSPLNTRLVADVALETVRRAPEGTWPVEGEL